MKPRQRCTARSTSDPMVGAENLAQHAASSASDRHRGCACRRACHHPLNNRRISTRHGLQATTSLAVVPRARALTSRRHTERVECTTGTLARCVFAELAEGGGDSPPPSCRSKERRARRRALHLQVAAAHAAAVHGVGESVTHLYIVLSGQHREFEVPNHLQQQQQQQQQQPAAPPALTARGRRAPRPWAPQTPSRACGRRTRSARRMCNEGRARSACRMRAEERGRIAMGGAHSSVVRASGCVGWR